MTEVPEVRYARSGDVHIAYQTFGAGRPFVGIRPFMQNIEALWRDPSGSLPRFLQRIGSFSTVTHLDKRGTGLSDRVAGFVGIEERIDDLRAVMDAAGIDRAAIGGISEGGPMAMLFAATYPERVDSLVLVGTTPRFTQADDYPDGIPPELFEMVVTQLADNRGTPLSPVVPMWMPSMASDEGFRTWMQSYERACASPGSVRDLMRFIAEVDVRSALPSIQAPTLVIHRTDDLVVPVALGRDVAKRIPGARYVEHPGADHVPWVGDTDRIVEEMEEFLTGRRATRRQPERPHGSRRARPLLGAGDKDNRRRLSRHIRQSEPRRPCSSGHPGRCTDDRNRDPRRTAHRGDRTAHRRRRCIAVHVAARISALAGASEILVSSTVRDLVLGSEFVFSDRGLHTLKGVDANWTILSLA